MGSSHHPVLCSSAAYMSMCVRDDAQRHVEGCGSAQRLMGGRGGRGRAEETHRHVRQLDNSIGQRVEEYELQMYKNPMSTQTTDTLTFISADPPVKQLSLTVRPCVSKSFQQHRAQRKCSPSDLTNPHTMGVQCVWVSTTKDVWLVVS